MKNGARHILGAPPSTASPFTAISGMNTNHEQTWKPSRFVFVLALRNSPIRNSRFSTGFFHDFRDGRGQHADHRGAVPKEPLGEFPGASPPRDIAPRTNGAPFWHLLFQVNDLQMPDVSGVIVCSVVPPADAHLRDMCRRYFKREPIFVVPGIKTGCPFSATTLRR